MYGGEQQAGNGHDMPRGFVPPGGGLGGATTTRAPMATEHLGKALKTAEALHVIISGLETRLDAVTRPVPPSPEAPNKQHMSGVQLSIGLMELDARLQAACARLDSLLNRVEL